MSKTSKDYFGEAWAVSFWKRVPRGIRHLVFAEAARQSGEFRKLANNPAVLEQVVKQAAFYCGALGAWMPSRLLGDTLGISAQAASRSLYNLREAQLIGWTVGFPRHAHKRAPVRRFRLGNRLRRLLELALERIRKIHRTKPEKHKQRPLGKGKAPVSNPVPDVPEMDRTTGNKALNRLRAALGRGRPDTPGELKA